MPKKAQLPPGAAGRSQQTLARRNRRDALGKWLMHATVNGQRFFPDRFPSC